VWRGVEFCRFPLTCIFVITTLALPRECVILHYQVVTASVAAVSCQPRRGIFAPRCLGHVAFACWYKYV